MNSCGSRYLLLPLEELPQPLEIRLVALRPDASLLVLPVRRDPVLRQRVHLLGADLHLERKAALAHDRRVQRAVAVGARHGDEVLDPAGHRRPGVVDDAERGVAVLDRLGDHPERHEVVHLVEIDLLPLELQVDAVEPLDAPVHLDEGNLGLEELPRNRAPQLLDHPFGGLALALDPGLQCLVCRRLEVLERQFLQLVLDLGHAEPVGNRRVDVERFLRNPKPLLLGQERQRPHVVQAVGQLDQDDADVVDHREQHLAEILRLALLARREGDRADLGDPLDQVGHLGTERLLEALGRRQRVLDDVVEQAGRQGDDVHPHVRQDAGHLQRMDQIRLARVAHLPLVLQGGETRSLGAAAPGRRRGSIPGLFR